MDDRISMGKSPGLNNVDAKNLLAIEVPAMRSKPAHARHPVLVSELTDFSRTGKTPDQQTVLTRLLPVETSSQESLLNRTLF